jgi:pseudaminic acid biosynthesis-associated methylase
MTEGDRLAGLWRGDFGNAYVERNSTLDPRRTAFWRSVIKRDIHSVLEVGCGQGGNLVPIAGLLPSHSVWGIDVNEAAVRRLRERAPDTQVVIGDARSLPFRDGLFDLAFTVGVLIHQPRESLSQVMAEIVRVSNRYVLWAEYYAREDTEVAYRGERGALFKRDFGVLYQEHGLALVREGFLGPDEGFDNVTWQLLAKPPQ